MANTISGVHFSTLHLLRERRGDNPAARNPSQSASERKDTPSDSVQLRAAAGSSEERPLSGRIGNSTEARELASRLREGIGAAPDKAAAAHALGEAQVHALLNRPPLP